MRKQNRVRFYVNSWHLTEHEPATVRQTSDRTFTDEQGAIALN